MHKYTTIIYKFMIRSLDVAIIGGGVVGCAIARKLSRYDLKLGVLEKGSDVCSSTSKANSGVVHAGFYYKTDSLKAKLCIEGNKAFDRLCSELDVPFKRVGKIVIAQHDEDIKELERMKKLGDANGVPGLKIIGKREVKKLEPNIKAVAGMHSPTSSIVTPYLLTIALAENAFHNGAEINLNTEVEGISKKGGKFSIQTNSGEFKARIIINSAGLYCDEIARMAGIDDYKIYFGRGEYHILDKSASNLINCMIYPIPPKKSGYLGVHLTPTIEGNMLIGPSMEYVEEDDASTTKGVLENLIKEAREILPCLPNDLYIQTFAGLRSKLVAKGENRVSDFIIEESKEVENFINLIGIESPGLTCAPSIANMVVEMIKGKVDLKLKKNFNPIRKGITRFDELSNEKKSKMIKKNSNYGHMVCRCEHVTKHEVIEALENPLGVKNINAVKYRCRATMGRCQGGFCKPKIVKIMEELYNPSIDEITQKGKGSHLFVGRTKDLRRNED
jgi:glycerol-3-phosphate dehydrogenase